MTVYHPKWKSTAKMLAAQMRSKGYNASYSKLKKGYCVSVRKK